MKIKMIFMCSIILCCLIACNQEVEQLNHKKDSNNYNLLAPECKPNDQNCNLCDEKYSQMMNQLFSSLSLVKNNDDIIKKCYRIGILIYEATGNSTTDFVCRDYTKWFLKCLKDKGVSGGSGVSMCCENCDNGQDKCHIVVTYPKGSSYCAGEPQLENNGESKSCCKPTRAEAEECAQTKHCRGLWPNGSKPKPGFEGCDDKPDYPVRRDCNYCMKERCTPEQFARVCEATGIDNSCENNPNIKSHECVGNCDSLTSCNSCCEITTTNDPTSSFHCLNKCKDKHKPTPCYKRKNIKFGSECRSKCSTKEDCEKCCNKHAVQGTDMSVCKNGCQRMKPKT